MSEMVIFVGLGVSLVAVFLFLLRTSGAQNGRAKKTSGETKAEKQLLAPEVLIERIFGAEDWNFLLESAPREAQDEFLKERTEIAFAWLALIRQRARTIMHLHLTQARGLRALEPAVELRVAANYLAFQINCSLVALLVWMRGPVATGKVIRRADMLCGKLHAITKVQLESNAGSMFAKR